MLVASITMMAVPAKKGIVTVTQPDGTSINIILHGDEHFHYTTTADGYLVKQAQDGFYMYAQQVGQSIATTNIRAKNTTERNSNEIALLKNIGSFKMSREVLDANRQMRAAKRDVATPQRTPHQAIRNLVILVSFKDKAFKKTKQEFDDQLNKKGYNTGGATGSVRDYFSTASNGQYEPQFDVYGPYTLDRNMSYYGGNDYNGHDSHPDQMVVDAVAKLAADKTANVDLSNYDTDKDGYIDNVFIQYAGYGENAGADANTIWPHRWQVSEYNVTGSTKFDGVYIYDYGCSAELKGSSGSNMSGIGVFCHEYSHILGLPDFYVTDYSSNHQTPAQWEIMDAGSYNNNERTPPTFSAHERFFVGWLTPIMLNAADNITLHDIKTSNTAYMITSTGKHNMRPENPNPKTYYLLENRQQTGWDEYVPGHGLLITKTVYNENNWYNNTPNNDKYNQGYQIANSNKAFPGSAKKTSYSPYSQYPITNIEENNGVITFNFMGGAITTHTVTFDARQYGACSITSTSESSPKEGVDLPDVTVTNDSCLFEGWSTKSEAITADAGKAYDTYFPKKDITLYAVYSVNGEIIKPETHKNCFVETFDQLRGETSEDVSTSLNDFTDNKGWSGKKVFPFNGVAKIGSNSYKGSISTPAINMSGNLIVRIKGYGKSTTTLSAEYGNSKVTKALGGSSSEIELYLNNFVSGNSITLTTSINVFYIDEIEICQRVATATENNADNNIMLIRKEGENQLINLEENSMVYCYDVAGRILWQQLSESSTMNFEAQNSFYIIRIVSDKKDTTIKGIK